MELVLSPNLSSSHKCLSTKLIKAAVKREIKRDVPHIEDEPSDHLKQRAGNHVRRQQCAETSLQRKSQMYLIRASLCIKKMT